MPPKGAKPKGLVEAEVRVSNAAAIDGLAAGMAPLRTDAMVAHRRRCRRLPLPSPLQPSTPVGPVAEAYAAYKNGTLDTDAAIAALQELVLADPPPESGAAACVALVKVLRAGSSAAAVAWRGEANSTISKCF